VLTLLFTAVFYFSPSLLGFSVAFQRAIGERLKTLACRDSARPSSGGGDGVRLPGSVGILIWPPLWCWNVTPRHLYLHWLHLVATVATGLVTALGLSKPQTLIAICLTDCARDVEGALVAVAGLSTVR